MEDILLNKNITYIDDSTDFSASIIEELKINILFLEILDLNNIDYSFICNKTNLIKTDAIVCNYNENNSSKIIELIEKIREIDDLIPIVINISTNYDEELKNLKFNISKCFNIPFDISHLFNKIEICLKNHNYIKGVFSIKSEFEKYLKAVDKVAIVSKTDLKGNITFANEIFNEISGYSNEELIGRPQSIVRHPQTPKEVFKELWSTIQNGDTWEGKLKNLAKDGSEYYVKTTIFPIHDSKGNIEEYISVRFLITEDELEKKNFRKKVLSNLQDFRKKEVDYNNKINSLEHKINNNELESKEEIIQELLQDKIVLKKQISDTEDELKKQIKMNELRINKSLSQIKEYAQIVKSLNNQIIVQKEITNKKDNLLKEANTKIIELEKRLTEKNKQVADLHDVIESKNK